MRDEGGIGGQAEFCRRQLQLDVTEQGAGIAQLRNPGAQQVRLDDELFRVIHWLRTQDQRTARNQWKRLSRDRLTTGRTREERQRLPDHDGPAIRMKSQELRQWFCWHRLLRLWICWHQRLRLCWRQWSAHDARSRLSPVRLVRRITVQHQRRLGIDCDCGRRLEHQIGLHAREDHLV